MQEALARSEAFCSSTVVTCVENRSIGCRAKKEYPPLRAAKRPIRAYRAYLALVLNRASSLSLTGWTVLFAARAPQIKRARAPNLFLTNIWLPRGGERGRSAAHRLRTMATTAMKERFSGRWGVWCSWQHGIPVSSLLKGDMQWARPPLPYR